MRHVVALVAGLIAVIAPYFIPSGVPGYLIMIAVAATAVAIGHVSVRVLGPWRGMAVVGLVVAYLGLIFTVGLLIVRVTRMFAG